MTLKILDLKCLTLITPKDEKLVKTYRLSGGGIDAIYLIDSVEDGIQWLRLKEFSNEYLAFEEVFELVNEEIKQELLFNLDIFTEKQDNNKE